MCKAKAGLAVTRITQKAVELLGPLGYSRKFMVEKWMRDAKICDIYEGTQQINQMARQLSWERSHVRSNSKDNYDSLKWRILNLLIMLEAFPWSCCAV